MCHGSINSVGPLPACLALVAVASLVDAASVALPPRHEWHLDHRGQTCALAGQDWGDPGGVPAQLEGGAVVQHGAARLDGTTGLINLGEEEEFTPVPGGGPAAGFSFVASVRFDKVTNAKAPILHLADRGTLGVAASIALGASAQGAAEFTVNGKGIAVKGFFSSCGLATDAFFGGGRRRAQLDDFGSLADFQDAMAVTDSSKFCHVAATVDAQGALKLYLDGQLQTPTNPTLGGEAAAPAAGTAYNEAFLGHDGAGAYLAGALHGARLDARALSAAEVLELAAKARPLKTEAKATAEPVNMGPPNFGGPARRWAFNEADGATVAGGAVRATARALVFGVGFYDLNADSSPFVPVPTTDSTSNGDGGFSFAAWVSLASLSAGGAALLHLETGAGGSVVLRPGGLGGAAAEFLVDGRGVAAPAFFSDPTTGGGRCGVGSGLFCHVSVVVSGDGATTTLYRNGKARRAEAVGAPIAAPHTWRARAYAAHAYLGRGRATPGT